MPEIDLRKFLDAAIPEMPGVEVGKSRFGNRPAYFVDGVEFVHFHSPRELDVRLTRRFQRIGGPMLRADARIGFRKANSEWVTLTVAIDADLEFAREVVKMAWQANRRR